VRRGRESKKLQQIRALVKSQANLEGRAFGDSELGRLASPSYVTNYVTNFSRVEASARGVAFHLNGSPMPPAKISNSDANPFAVAHASPI